MQKIQLSREEILKYPTFVSGKSNEAIIKEFNNTELIKLFHYYSEYKIETLEEIEKERKNFSLIKELLIHKAVITSDDIIIAILIDKGYPMTFRRFLKESPSFEQVITILKNIGKLLETLKHIREEEQKLTSFFIGDLHEGNILVNPESLEIQIIDLDSCKIGNNHPFLTKYLQFLKTYQYIKTDLSYKYPSNRHNVSPNENTDLYCYCVMILKNLFGIDITKLDITEFYEQLYNLKIQGLPLPLYQSFLDLYRNTENKNPYKLLDDIPSSFEKKRTP